jgi:hypothetical protein
MYYSAKLGGAATYPFNTLCGTFQGLDIAKWLDSLAHNIMN